MRRGLTRMSEGDVHRFVWNTRRLLDHAPLDLTRPPDVPTLVFTGEHDVFTRPEYCRRIADHVQGARFTTIPEADHIFHLQRFDATVDLLLRFVDGRLDAPRPGDDVPEPIEDLVRVVAG
jgi:pimeloyl-ACP methyl ester carboxylesterase